MSDMGNVVAKTPSNRGDEIIESKSNFKVRPFYLLVIILLCTGFTTCLGLTKWYALAIVTMRLNFDEISDLLGYFSNPCDNVIPMLTDLSILPFTINTVQFDISGWKFIRKVFKRFARVCAFEATLAVVTYHYNLLYLI